jgi:hypothetical protein
MDIATGEMVLTRSELNQQACLNRPKYYDFGFGRTVSSQMYKGEMG